MDKGISQRVVGLLSTLSSEQDEHSEGLVVSFLADLFQIDVSVSKPFTVQDVAQAVADELKDPLTDLMVVFCAAFVRLAKVNDSGTTSKTSADVLQELALQWAQDGE
jgi:hypothetical protein